MKRIHKLNGGFEKVSESLKEDRKARLTSSEIRWLSAFIVLHNGNPLLPGDVVRGDRSVPFLNGLVYSAG